MHNLVELLVRVVRSGTRAHGMPRTTYLGRVVLLTAPREGARPTIGAPRGRRNCTEYAPRSCNSSDFSPRSDSYKLY